MILEKLFDKRGKSHVKLYTPYKLAPNLQRGTKMRITCKHAAVAALLFLCSALNSQVRAADPEVAVVVKIGGIPWFTAMEQGIIRAGKEDQVNAYMVGPTTSDRLIASLWLRKRTK